MTFGTIQVQIALTRWTDFVIFTDARTAPSTEDLATSPAESIFKKYHSLTTRAAKDVAGLREGSDVWELFIIMRANINRVIELGVTV